MYPVSPPDQTGAEISADCACTKNEEALLVHLGRGNASIEQMIRVVVFQDDPVMIARFIPDASEARVGKLETRTLKIGLGYLANDSVHDHVQQTPVGDHQIMARIEFEQLIEGSPCSQVELPLTFTC